MAKTKVVAKGVAGVMKPALEKLFVKQADDVAAKAAREAAEDAAEKAAKEAAQKAGKEAAEEAAERTGKEAGEEAAEKAAKEARPPGTKCKGGDPIDLATGEVLLTQTDVQLAGVLPLVLERTHISSHRSGHLFGISWASTIDQRLEPSASEVAYTAPDGMVLRFPPLNVPNVVARPVAGPQHWHLTVTSEGGYALADRQAGRTLHFPPPGRYGWTGLPLTAISDSNGNRIDFEYEENDGEATLAQIRHSGGYWITVQTGRYGSAGHNGRDAGLRRVTALWLRTDRTADRPGGVLLMRYSYDTAGNLAEVINASGTSLRFSYDEEHRLTGWTDRNGDHYEYVYDGAGRAVAGTGSQGFLNARIDYRAGRTVLTDSLGHRTTYEFNDMHQLAAVTDPLGNTVRTQWDRHHQLLAQTDALGRTTRFTYDEDGNPTAVTRPDGTTSSALYNEAMLPERLVEPSGASRRYAYDERGNLTDATDPAGAVTSYRYNELGHLIAVREPLGGVTRIESNGAGLPIAVTDPRGGVTRFERDVFGRVVAVTDRIGGVTRYGWTVGGQLAWRTRPDGASEKWSYDAEENLVEYTDPLGQTSRTETGPFGLPTAQTGPDGARLEFGHDTELRVVSITNPQGLVWRYTYDAAGNLTSEVDFNGRHMAYAHDAAGRLISRTNALGETMEFVRDALGQVIEQRCDGQVTTFAYDPAGRLEQATNQAAALRFERDALGRITAEFCNGRLLSSAYDANGRRIARRTPSGAESIWTYDAADLPVTLNTGGQVIRFDHDMAGREVQRHIGVAAIVTQQYDAAHRMVAQNIWGAPGRPGQSLARPAAPGRTTIGPDPEEPGRPRLLQQRAYTFGANGNVTGIVDRFSGQRAFELDAIGRVTAVHARVWTERYAYDGGGNLTQASWPAPPDRGDTPATSHHGPTGPSHTATPTGSTGLGDPAHSARSLEAAAMGEREFDGTLVRRAGRVRYEHDAQGRVILRQHARLSAKTATWRYVWDAEDRLVGVQTPDGTHWRYLYDPLGRRIAKQRLSSNGQVTEQIAFAWDGVRLAEQAHTTWSSGRQGVTVCTVWEYASDSLTPLTQTERLPAKNAPQQWIDQRFHAIVTDLIGTPSELVDVTGNITWAHRTSLWGNGLTQPHGGVDCPLRFPGQYRDEETGLHYNYHRHYDPVLGCYGSADPLGILGGLNPHAYVPNPLVWRDPLGLTPVSLDQVKMVLGRAGMSVSDYDIVHVPEIRDLSGREILGRSSVDGAGNPVLGPRGRPLIEVTDRGLSPRIDPEFGPRTGTENAVETIYHEIHHIKSNQLRGHGDTEASAEEYGRRMLDKFRGRCKG